MKQRQMHLIASVEKGSIAAKYQIEPGDILLSINGQEIEDVFDYRYLQQAEILTVRLLKKDQTERELRIRKDIYADLGLEFENEFMSDYRSCTNQCIFCFIDQMPPGMRETLYFKDDDSRLSFLQGNYITLTNMKEHDIERIIQYRLAPINISVHTTNPKLRCEMLHNRFAGDALNIMQRFFDAGISMNGQIVLCPNVNDGEELKRTIRDLRRYAPVMESVSVVPAGLTKYRQGLYPLEPVTPELARETIDIIEAFQKEIYAETGLHFIHASDEFYILAGRPVPKEEQYDGYMQLENGVGMIRLQYNEVQKALRKMLLDYGKRHLHEMKTVVAVRGGKKRKQYLFPNPHYVISIATGRLAAPYIRKYAGWFMRYFPGVHIYVYDIRNDFFGEQITVAGLITGQDLIHQLKGQPLGEALCLPSCMFRSGEAVFLDDITKEEAEKALQVSIHIVKSSGQALIETFMLGLLPGIRRKKQQKTLHSPYELEQLYGAVKESGG